MRSCGKRISATSMIFRKFIRTYLTYRLPTAAIDPSSTLFCIPLCLNIQKYFDEPRQRWRILSSRCPSLALAADLFIYEDDGGGVRRKKTKGSRPTSQFLKQQSGDITQMRTG